MGAYGQNLTISFIFFLILTTTHINSNVEGRHMAKWIVVNSKIGSSPPRCNNNRRCDSCKRCEAIQVPTNPQIQNGIKNSTSTTLSSISLSRNGDYNSNYKPMSWKCKCGDLIFNP